MQDKGFRTKFKKNITKDKDFCKIVDICHVNTNELDAENYARKCRIYAEFLSEQQLVDDEERLSNMLVAEMNTLVSGTVRLEDLDLSHIEVCVMVCKEYL